MTATFKLDDFEGPLDLLIYLIEKNKMSIDNIEIASITDQYLAYLEEAAEYQIEQTSEFIVMAATLLYMKSKMLLPKVNKSKEEDEEEEDPRQELIEKLLEYKKMKYVSQKLDERQSKADRQCFREEEAHINIPSAPLDPNDILKDMTLDRLYEVFEMLLKQQKLVTPPSKEIDYNILKRDTYTVEQKSSYIINLIKLKHKIRFFDLCNPQMPKIELIVTFMAILELVHKKKIHISQNGPLEDIEMEGIETNG